VRHEFLDLEINITNDNILNETLILIENELLKIIGKRLTDLGKWNDFTN